MVAEADPDSPRSPRLSRRARLGLLAGGGLALIVVLIWLAYYQLRGKYLEGTDDAYVRADAVTVSPKIAGYVAQVLVADNQDVRAGQPLARIDARDYQAQAAQYQAQIDVARADAANVRAGIREQEAAIAQARAQLAVARTDAAFAAAQVVRYAPLSRSGAETREKFAELRHQASQAAGTAASQAAALAQAERRVESLRAQIHQAEAQGEVARAQLGAANVNLGSAILRAPVDGRVGDKSVRVGQFVASGTRLMSIVPLRSLYVTANFKETQVGLMRVGQPATLKVDALPGVELPGHLQSITPGTGAQFSLLPPQNATGNFTKIVQRVPVRIAIDAGPEARRVLVPGLSVEVTVDTISARGEIGRIQDQERARRREGQ